VCDEINNARASFKCPESSIWAGTESKCYFGYKAVPVKSEPTCVGGPLISVSAIGAIVSNPQMHQNARRDARETLTKLSARLYIFYHFISSLDQQL